LNPRIPTVIDVVKQRAARQSRAPHGDGARVALVVEGGAMRAVISAGMVSGLESLGLATAFDEVYGSSAGAINAAYFVAGQAALGTTIYYEDINTRQFISRARLASGGPIVDLGFLVEEIIRKRKPLDVQRILASPSPLAVLATDVASAEAAVLRGFTTPAELVSALRAGATMPAIAGAPWRHHGRQYLDAALSEPIPVRAAEAEGATHVLALLTRPGPMPWRTSFLDRWYVGPRLRRWSPVLAERYLNRGDSYADLLANIEAGTGPLNRASVVGLKVPGLVVEKLERDAETLRAAASRGCEVVIGAFR
jgi:predicted patatin/cPLA2 family phospholipase